MASVLPSFIFGGNTGVTSPDDLARRRALAEALLNRGQAGGPASNVGEGLAQLGAALGGRFRLEGVRGEERKAKASASDLFRSLMTGQGGSAPMTQTAATVTPTSAPAPASGADGVRRAFLDALAGPESAGDYNVIYGGQKVSDLSRHPRIAVPIKSGPNKGKTSSAAGKYQFLGSTWDQYAGKLGLKDFSPQSQDAAAWALASDTYRAKTGGDLEQVLASGDPQAIAGVGRALSDVWTSLPGGIEQGTSDNRFVQAFQGGLGQPVAQQQPTTPVPAAAPSPINVMPASAPAPQQPMQQAPQTAYERMMATANAKDGVPMPSRAPQNAPQAMPPQMAPQMPPAMQPAPMASQDAPQPMQPQQPANRMAQIAAAIGNPSFAFLEPMQQKFLLDEYQREMEAANPDPMKTLQMQKLQAEVDQLQNPGANTEYGLNPQFGVDADGNPVMIQVGKNGQAVQTQMPPDVKLSREPIKFDAGTHFVMLDPVTRQPIGTIPKDLAGAEKQKEIGTAQGKAAGAATSDIATADMALDILDSIENDPNLSWGVGRSSVFNFIPGSPGLDFQNKVDQATSGAFLSAIQQMRGLGALSNAEGSTATKAVTRMSTSTSEEAFRSALSDYRKLVQLGRERAVAMANGVSPDVPAGQPAPATGGGSDIDMLLKKYGGQ